MADSEQTKNLFDVEGEEQDEDERRPFNSAVFLRMVSFGTPYRGKLAIAAALILLRTIISVAEPLLIAYAINEGIATGDASRVIFSGLTLLGLTLLSLLCGRWQLKILGQTGQHILYDIRLRLFSHIQTLSFDFFDSRPVGKIITRLTGDVDKISEMVNSGVINIITQLLSLLFILTSMFWINSQLALRAVALLPFIIIFIWAQRGPLESLWMGERRAQSNLNAHINETVTGMTIIQAFSREKTNAAKFDILNERILTTHMKPVTLEILFWPLVDITYALANALIFWYGAQELIAGRLDAGSIVAFIAYQDKFWSPITTFARYYSQMLSAMASAERVFEFIDYPALINDDPAAEELPVISGAVEFNKVSFAYQSDRPVLNNVSFMITPGMKVALVGPTGAGKSTIINLLARFYDPTSGSIHIDGHDIRKVRLASLRAQLGIVLQDSFIFSGTIRQNIAYGRPEATMEEIVAAAKAAGAHEFISQLKDGYNTVTEERGGSLSLGQRQLLSFARALLAAPRVLILDEATSSIDTETEMRIQEAIAVLLKGRTSFIIAHRLATIQGADLILVVENGTISESGSHEELLRQRGTYYRLHETQYRLQEKLLKDYITGDES